MAQSNFEERIDTYEIESTNVMTGDRDRSRYLYYQLKMSMAKAKQIDIIVSFLIESGVRMLLNDMKRALERGVKIRILTGNYLGITQPSALYLIKGELGDRVDLRLYNETSRSFHPKSYIFHYGSSNEIYIGSSNISKSALTSGIEWNYRFSDTLDKKNYELFYATFEDLFLNHSIIINDEELKRYSKAWKKPAVSRDLAKYDATEDNEDRNAENVRMLYRPRGAQIEALYALQESRMEGAAKGLVYAATGIGKTYLAAFDSAKYERVLFVAHREEILKQAAVSFKNVRNSEDYGFFDGKEKDTDKSVIFASVATLGRPEYLNETYFPADYFDYVIIDEFHHAVTDQYRRYIIDRSSEISQIRKDGFNFISIQGEAGSGKSALCKLLLEKEKMVLYTRAEKIAEVSSLEDIWGLDIGKTIEYLKKKKLYIYIDALEFIVDCSKTKMDLLQQIYEIVKGHNNIFIITSCRTCDRTAFVKIENIYQIKRYDIFLLSDKQIIKVAQKYKIVQKLWDAKGYVQLLRSPFYLNLLVKEIKDFKKISDIDGFRNLIWNDIMCMSGKTFPQGITHSAVREAIEKIVFNRAEKFLPGVRKEEIGEEIVNILQSENIITTCSNNTIRLKYDIFEDICFERFIDEKYDDCKNDFGIFFLNLEKMGRCIYRRYQIWVENKLFSKGNREKFLYKLLETDNIPSGWKVQTIVGIVKSNFCSELFEEYKYYLNG